MIGTARRTSLATAAVALMPALLGLATAARGSEVAAAATTEWVVAPFPVASGVGTERNEDIEPGIGVDGAGTIWAGSDIDPNPNTTAHDPRSGTNLTGEDLWMSSDGGRTYRWVADPFAQVDGKGLAGEDSDVSVAREPNAKGFSNVYAVSLYLASSSVAISQDGGRTFSLDPLGGVPAEDRPWVSADGACVFYVTYHQLPLFAPVINKYDVCNRTDLGAGVALNPVQSTQIFLSNTAPGLTNLFNKPMVDNWRTSPYWHTLYVPMEGCDLQNPADYVMNVVSDAEMAPTCPSGVPSQVTVAVSTDGGSTFDDYAVALNSNGELQGWPTTIAVDRAGTVYVAWSDNHNAFFSFSKDQGKTWSPAKQINTAPSLTATYPTVAADGAGVVGVAWYGTSIAGDTNDQSAMGTPDDTRAAPWKLYWTKSSNGGRSFTQVAITGVIHTGVLCTEGSACSIAKSRNLYDDFGAVISPTTGLAAIAFDADQPPSGAPVAGGVDPYTAYASEVGHGGHTGRAPTVTPRPVNAATPASPGGSAAAPSTGGPAPAGVAAPAQDPATSNAAARVAGVPGVNVAAALVPAAAVAVVAWGRRRRARRSAPTTY
jgi:hypothetical protein